MNNTFEIGFTDVQLGFVQLSLNGSDFEDYSLQGIDEIIYEIEKGRGDEVKTCKCSFSDFLEEKTEAEAVEYFLNSLSFEEIKKRRYPSEVNPCICKDGCFLCKNEKVLA